MFEGKSCRDIQDTHFMFRNSFRISRRLWDNVEKCGRAREATDDNIIRRMRCACWITTGYRRTRYVVRNVFPRQQWFREHATILRCTFSACLVICAESVDEKVCMWSARWQVSLLSRCVQIGDTNTQIYSLHWNGWVTRGGGGEWGSFRNLKWCCRGWGD